MAHKDRRFKPDSGTATPAGRRTDPLGFSAGGKIFFITIAVFLCFGVPHAAYGLDPTKQLDQYVHQILTEQNGLPSNAVQVITQTRDGYLWVGTSEGVARFDGVQFEVFDRASGQLPGNFIYSLLEDSKGTLWIGTNGGLVRYQSGRFLTVGNEAGLAGARVWGLAEDRSGNIWLAADNGLYSYHEGLLTRFDLSADLGLPNRPRDVVVDKTGTVWVVLSPGIVCRLQKNRFETVPEFSALMGKNLFKPSVDREGAIWLSSFDGGAYCYQNGQLAIYGQNESWANSTETRDLRDRDGNVWIGTTGGLARVFEGKSTIFHSDRPDIPKSVLAVFEDREGNLWVGTDGQGLHRFTDGSFVSFGPEEGLPSAPVNAVCEDFDHNIWVGTFDHGIYRGRRTFTHLPIAVGGSAEDFSINAFLTDPRDRSIWIATTRGLFHRQGESVTQYTKKDGLPNDDVTALCFDDQQDLWIATNVDVACFREGKFSVPAELAQFANGTRISGIANDGKGGIWFAATTGPILYRKGRVTQFGRKDGLMAVACLSLCVDSEGVVWISIQNGGLAEYLGDRFFTYTQHDGLPSDELTAILDDSLHGCLWLGSGKGVFRVRARADRTARGWSLGPSSYHQDL